MGRSPFALTIRKTALIRRHAHRMTLTFDNCINGQLGDILRKPKDSLQ